MNIDEALEILDEQFAAPSGIGGIHTNLKRVEQELKAITKLNPGGFANKVSPLDKKELKNLAKASVDLLMAIRGLQEK